jgi:hypothetical protein
MPLYLGVLYLERLIALPVLEGSRFGLGSYFSDLVGVYVVPPPTPLTARNFTILKGRVR